MSVTFVRMVKEGGKEGSAATRPVDEDPKDRGDAGQDEQEAETQIAQIGLAEIELITFDGPGRRVELHVAVHAPIDGVEGESEVAGRGDTGVGNEVGIAKQNKATAPDAER